ncbi:MAG: hypothetical protein JSW39_26675 [Desulfobacterales bacterium]|nr:MAG: hypothetical protein JSW39_26675 [Desulfobacterales bacterium]
MNSNRRHTLLVITLALTAFATLAFASQAGEKISLMATNKHPNASGTAVINATSIQIAAKGLKPNSVYTAWFVNTKPQKHETGAGQPPICSEPIPTVMVPIRPP